MKNAEGVDNRAAQSAAAARLIRQRAPEGAAAALLAYAPDADSDAAEDEIVASLAILGVHDGKVDAAVVAALKDKAPACRAAAGVVVGRSGTAEQAPTCRSCWPTRTPASASGRPRGCWPAATTSPCPP